jgi:hypothetical protein
VRYVVIEAVSQIDSARRIAAVVAAGEGEDEGEGLAVRIRQQAWQASYAS